MMARSSKRKDRVDPATKLAATILPAQAVANDRFVIRDIANHSEADQRHMVRSGEKRTIRRLTHLEKLHRRRVINMRQLAICQWYSDQREIGYSTLGITANYCGAGGGGFGSKDLLARYRAQNEARNNYGMARDAIELRLISLFERIVVAHYPLRKSEETEFNTACQQLEDAVGHLMSFE